jgi:hypothetical protein
VIKQVRSWRVCPKCGSRATKRFSLNTGKCAPFEPRAILGDYGMPRPNRDDDEIAPAFFTLRAAETYSGQKENEPCSL